MLIVETECLLIGKPFCFIFFFLSLISFAKWVLSLFSSLVTLGFAWGRVISDPNIPSLYAFTKQLTETS